MVSATRVTVPALPQADVRRLVHTMPGWAGGTTQATGLLLTPKGAPPAGGWPVIVWAHGTTSLAYKGCAPSDTLDDLDGGLTAEGFTSHYGAVIGYLVGAGYAVVAPDFEGLGSAATAAYPHYSADSESRSLIAALKAARLADPDLSRKWMAVGHSEGARGVLVVQNYLSEVSELDFRGAVAFAPFISLAAVQPLLEKMKAADPAKAGLYRALQSNAVVGVSMGLKTIKPGTDLTSLMGADLIALLPNYAKQCVFAAGRPLFAEAASNPAFDGVKPGWSSVPAMRAFLQGNDPAAMPDFRLAAPTYIVQGTADVFALEPLTTSLVNTLAGRGSPVSYRVYSGSDHGTIVLDARSDVLAFIADRFTH